MEETDSYFILQIAYIIILSLLPVAFSETVASSTSANADETGRVKREGFNLIGGAFQVKAFCTIHKWTKSLIIVAFRIFKRVHSVHQHHYRLEAAAVPRAHRDIQDLVKIQATHQVMEKANMVDIPK